MRTLGALSQASEKTPFLSVSATRWRLEASTPSSACWRRRLRRARRADVRLTRRADARSTSAPDGAPELLLPITYYVLPKNMNFCHMLDYNTIK